MVKFTKHEWNSFLYQRTLQDLNNNSLLQIHLRAESAKVEISCIQDFLAALLQNKPVRLSLFFLERLMCKDCWKLKFADFYTKKIDSKSHSKKKTKKGIVFWAVILIRRDLWNAEWYTILWKLTKRPFIWCEENARKPLVQKQVPLNNV